MRAKSFVIFSRDTSWLLGVDAGATSRVSPIDLPAQATIADQASVLVEALKTEGWAGEAVIWALASDQCLCTSLDLVAVPRRHRSALMYEIEDLLPVPAEDVVADFLTISDRALGVCVETAKVAPLLQALQSLGVLVEYVCPAALLAVQSMLLDESDRLHDSTIAWIDDPNVEIVMVKNGLPVEWHSVAADEASLRERSSLLWPSGKVASKMLLAGTPTDIITAALPPAAETFPQSLVNAAVKTGSAIVTGRIQPWINLRRGALAVADPLRLLHRPLLTTLSAALIFLTCTTVSLLVRAGQNDILAAEQRSVQRQLAAQVLSRLADDATPLTQLTFEERRQRGLSGTAGTSPRPASALRYFHQALSTIPATLRIRLLDIRIDADKLYIEGETRTHGDAESFAKELRSIPQWSVDAPRSEQGSEKAVTFVLTVRIPSPTQNPEQIP